MGMLVIVTISLRPIVVMRMGVCMFVCMFVSILRMVMGVHDFVQGKSCLAKMSGASPER